MSTVKSYTVCVLLSIFLMLASLSSLGNIGLLDTKLTLKEPENYPTGPPVDGPLIPYLDSETYSKDKVVTDYLYLPVYSVPDERMLL